ncbi:MAG: glycosyltransferase family 4 protein [Actinomycetota bacterium]
MRIALTCPYAWDDPGGVQVHVKELAGRLEARGHQIVVLAPVRQRADEPWVVPIGKPLNIPYNASNAPIDPRPWSRGVVRGALAAFGPDVVHAHEPLAPSTSLWATLESQAAVVGTFHSGATRSRLFDLAAPVLRRVAGRLSMRIAVSERAAAFARERIGGTFEIVPNGIDVERWATAEPRDLGPGTKVLFVGRLDERKGFPVAVEAFRRLAGAHEDLRMVVAGDGPQGDAVEELPPDLQARVTMLGHVPNAELPTVSAACDLYVGPSTGGESFGIVVVEAMAAGLPVVASDTPGYDEVVRDGVDGLLVPPRDPVALAAGAEVLLGDPDLAARLAAAGRERAASFDWQVVVRRLEDLYDRAIDAGPASLR